MDLARAILAQSNGGADKVCRNLFGTVDHKILREDYENILSDTIEEAKKKWNFDFANETPLEGDFRWEKVDCPMACLHCGKMSCLKCEEVDGIESDGGKRKQALITDYYQIKRCRTPGSSPKPSSP